MENDFIKARIELNKLYQARLQKKYENRSRRIQNSLFCKFSGWAERCLRAGREQNQKWFRPGSNKYEELKPKYPSWLKK